MAQMLHHLRQHWNGGGHDGNQQVFEVDRVSDVLDRWRQRVAPIRVPVLPHEHVGQGVEVGHGRHGQHDLLPGTSLTHVDHPVTLGTELLHDDHRGAAAAIAHLTGIQVSVVDLRHVNRDVPAGQTLPMAQFPQQGM